MAVAQCSECQTHFEPPFDDKELAIWFAVCKEHEDWLCLECADLAFLKDQSEYISIEGVE